MSDQNPKRDEPELVRSIDEPAPLKTNEIRSLLNSHDYDMESIIEDIVLQKAK
jgi:hypothetical protein